MGCGQSKVDDLPLVIRCKERKELIKAAADYRYSLSAAHILYFSSLNDVGEALCRFVDEEFVVGGSPLDSPVLTLPSDEGKKGKDNNFSGTSRNVGGKHKGWSNWTSRGSISHGHSVDDGGGGDLHDSHLQLSSDSDSELSSSSGHIHVDDHSPDIRTRDVVPPRQSAQNLNGYGVDRYPSWEPNGYAENMNPSPQSAWQPYGYGMNVVDQPYGMNVVDRPYGMNVVDQPYGTNVVNQSYEMNVEDQPYQTGWGQYGGNSNSYAYYMKRSGPSVRTVIHGEGPSAYANSYTGYPDATGGFFGFPMSSQAEKPPSIKRPSPPAEPPPPPPPSGSGWDFLNPFNGYEENGYLGNYSKSVYGYGSIASSPDSNEVREKEGIPHLEEETETEVIKKIHKQNNMNVGTKKIFGERTSKAVPSEKGEDSSRADRSHDSEGSPRTMASHSTEASRAMAYNERGSKGKPSLQSERTSRAGLSQNNEEPLSGFKKDENSSPDTILTMSSEDSYVQKKEVSFEVEEASLQDVDTSKMSSFTALSTHGNRDIQEVVEDIKNEFEMASSHGKEIALMLEVGKLPYIPKSTVFKVALSRIMGRKETSLASPHTRSRTSVNVDLRTVKLAKSYNESSAIDTTVDYGNISSILEELYAWEKKLYKEVKGEERLRLIYEKLCKKQKALNDKGAESSKIDANRASTRNLLTKLNVCMRGIEAISNRIQKLRDDELQPRVTKLIHGFIRLWKFMLKCHQKQFQAIMESKTRTLKSNSGLQRDSRLRATLKLETELRMWCSYFNDWVNAQKCYVESLNGWLFRCLDHEPEVTPDGIVPFSPGRIGAPPIYVICHDWQQAMEVMKGEGVANSMQHFASNLRHLWERQDEEQRHGLKAEFLSKDYDKRMKALRSKTGKLDRNQDALSAKTIVGSDSGVSRRDDLKVDLDLMRKRMDEERIRHSDAIKLVQDAASSSLQGGLLPIFKALENFSSEALKAHEQVRLQITGEGS
ncbi:nitrate regulatory gene2 protein [Heracleum sosnowskyi]|uniref:Nitrate regulatory gene2 protein n=1 Tax=Heracleum sosnowskyi TaxID=360622 RepID=A0AAD8MPH0_9APIA|nr:nitrate regulatory gene2 protein [Heracleum sosnowskyi]